jgi:hypothetical protein
MVLLTLQVQHLVSRRGFAEQTFHAPPDIFFSERAP